MKALVLLCLLSYQIAMAQQALIDPWHFQSVWQNGIVRSSAEAVHQRYLEAIVQDIDNLDTNTGAVALAQTIIYQGLSGVNSALKNGMEVKNMTATIADMNGYIRQVLAMARSDPYLLAFAGQISAAMKSRAMALIGDVSSFVLRSGGGVLADYNARDELLHQVAEQLQLLDSLAYGAWKTMYWVKQRGIIASLNPFGAYISSDIMVISLIIAHAKYLRQ